MVYLAILSRDSEAPTGLFVAHKSGIRPKSNVEASLLAIAA
jgi:hypothetical protein